MNRRDFLKIGSLASAVGFLAVGPMDNVLALPIETTISGKLYRGTADGKIYTSQNGGKSWQLQSKFPKGFAVLDIFPARDKQIYAHIGYKRVNFHLVLTKDGKSWVSQPFKTTPKPVK